MTMQNPAVTRIVQAHLYALAIGLKPTFPLSLTGGSGIV